MMSNNDVHNDYDSNKEGAQCQLYSNHHPQELIDDRLIKAFEVIEQLKAELNDLRNRKEQLSEENDELVNDIQYIIAENEELRSILSEREKELEVVQVNFNKVKAECDDLHDKLECASTYHPSEPNLLDPVEVEQLIQQMRVQMKRKIRDAEAEKERIQDALAELELERDEMQVTLNSLASSKIKIEQNVLELKDELYELKNHAANVTFQNQSMYQKLMYYQTLDDSKSRGRQTIPRRHSVGGRPESTTFSCDCDVRRQVENMEHTLKSFVIERSQLREVLSAIRLQHERTQEEKGKLEEELRGLKYYAGRLTLEKKALVTKLNELNSKLLSVSCKGSKMKS
jgi:predicted nuclease with TOPRIM domain